MNKRRHEHMKVENAHQKSESYRQKEIRHLQAKQLIQNCSTGLTRKFLVPIAGKRPEGSPVLEGD